MGLPEARLECDSNYLTQIENKYVKRESNRIKKLNNPVKNGESNQVEMVSQINSKTVANVKLLMPMAARAPDN